MERGSTTGAASITLASCGGTVQVDLVLSNPEALVDLYGVLGIDKTNVVRFEGMQWAPLDADLTSLREVDGWINSRRGEHWTTDGDLAAVFNSSLAPGQHVIATFTLGVAPGPGVYRVAFFAGTSATTNGTWVSLEESPLMITVLSQ